MTAARPVLLSIQTGLPQDLSTNGESWRSGIWKRRVDHPVWLSREHLEGDAVADTRNHGGPEMAVLAYCKEHYHYWRQIFGRELEHGSFGENFTVSALSERVVREGDTFHLGEAVIQASRPRRPCWKLARRLQRESIIQEVMDTGYSGWYFRVLQEGRVQAGDQFVLCDAGDGPTMYELNQSAFRSAHR